MATKEVEIRLVDPGPSGPDDRTIQYIESENPIKLSVSKKDKIKWKCEYPFAVHIGYDSPFEKGRYRGQGSVVANLDDDFTLLEGEEQRCIKYSVSVCDDRGRVWTDDPILIIER